MTHDSCVCESILAISNYGSRGRLCHPCVRQGSRKRRSLLDSRLRGNDKDDRLPR